MKATTESNFDALPWYQGATLQPTNESLVAKVDFLLDNLEDIPAGYRRDLVMNASLKIQHYGRKEVGLFWSHNEEIMLERIYERFGGVR